MKPILIDTIKEKFLTMMTATDVTIDGEQYTGYVCAKPLNYDPEYFSMRERQEMADAILEGKAIAVCFFDDLTEEDKVSYMRTKLPRPQTDDSSLAVGKVISDSSKSRIIK